MVPKTAANFGEKALLFILILSLITLHNIKANPFSNSDCESNPSHPNCSGNDFNTIPSNSLLPLQDTCPEFYYPPNCGYYFNPTESLVWTSTTTEILFKVNQALYTSTFTLLDQKGVVVNFPMDPAWKPGNDEVFFQIDYRYPLPVDGKYKLLHQYTSYGDYEIRFEITVCAGCCSSCSASQICAPTLDSASCQCPNGLTGVNCDIPQQLEILALPYDESQRSITVSWKPPVRDPGDTVYYSFYLAPPDVDDVNMDSLSQALFPLSCSISTTDESGQSIQSSGLYSVPESYTGSIVVKIPPIPSWSFLIDSTTKGWRIWVFPTQFPTSIEPSLRPQTVTLVGELNSVCLSANPPPNAYCDDYTGLVVCNSGYTRVGNECILDSQFPSPQCSLQCPSLMKPSSNCLQCICDTLECTQQTRVGMLKLTFNDNVINENATLLQKRLFASVHSLLLSQQLSLNQLPISTLYSQQSLSAPIGIEEITIKPLFEGDETVLSIFYSIKPFKSTTTPQIDKRLADLANSLGKAINFSKLTNLDIVGQKPYPTFKWVTFSNTPGTTDILQAVCKHQSADKWTTCSSLASSPQWSLCSSTGPSAAGRSLTIACRDYYGAPFIVPFVKGCEYGKFNLYPAITTWSAGCSQEPRPSLKDVLFDPTSGLIAPPQPGTSFVISWNYGGSSINTVSVFLTNIALITVDAYSVSTDTKIYTEGFNLNSDEYNDIRSTTTNSDFFNEFNTLQTNMQSILLGTYPAKNNGARITLPYSITPTTDAILRAIVTQQVDVVSNSDKFTIIAPSGLCDVVPPSATVRCNINTGVYSCKPGYKATSGQGSTLNCIPTCFGMCQNGGQCVPADENSGSSSSSSLCQCPAGIAGEYCETKDSCRNDICNGNGFVLLDGTQNCSQTCRCTANWSSPTTTEASKQCQSCLLTDKRIGNVPKCDDIGTDTTETNKKCDKCICKIGFTGENCQLRALIGTLKYDLVDSGAQIAQGGEYIPLSSHTETTNNNDQAREEEALFLHFSTQANPPTPTPIQIPPSTMSQLQQDMALSLGVTSNQVQITKSTQSYNTTTSTTTTSVSFSILSATTSTATQNTDSSGGFSIDNLYNSWGNLQDQYKNLPISTSTDQYGTLNQPQAPFDPNCASGNQAIEQCPAGENPFEIVPTDQPSKSGSNTTVIIIAVVICVGVVGLVVLIAILLKYSHKNKVWCFSTKFEEKHSQVGTNTGGTEMSATHTTLTASSQSSSRPGESKTAQSYDFGEGQKGGVNHSSMTTKHTIDLVQIEDPTLPPNWSKFRHKVTNEEFYTNDIEMKSQKFRPGTKVEENANGW